MGVLINALSTGLWPAGPLRPTASTLRISGGSTISNINGSVMHNVSVVEGRAAINASLGQITVVLTALIRRSASAPIRLASREVQRHASNAVLSEEIETNRRHEDHVPVACQV